MCLLWLWGGGDTVRDERDHRTVRDWLDLIQAEYREMPGLSLTKRQMQRLWGIESFVCDVLVEALVAAQVLKLTRGGTYVANGSGH